MNIFKNLTEDEKIKAKNKILYTFFATVFIIGCFFTFNSLKHEETPKEILNYSFLLNGENMSSIMVCENEWHYELIENFVPCVINKTVGGIAIQGKNKEYSPQENCHKVGGEFTGFNIYNMSRSKELYDKILPKCFELNETQISYVWLNASGCVCSETNSFHEGCEEYDCGGGLIVDDN